MSADLYTLFTRLPDLAPTASDTAWRGVEPDAFVRRIGAAGNRFGEWRRLARDAGVLAFPKMLKGAR